MNYLPGVAAGQISEHVQEDRIIELRDWRSFGHLLEATFCDRDRMATVERTIWEMTQKHWALSQNYTELQVIATDLDLNTLALKNAVRMGSLEEMKDSFQNSIMPEECPALVTVCQTQDSQIRQCQLEETALFSGMQLEFAISPKDPTPPNVPAASAAEIVAGYSGPAPLDHNTGKQ